MASTSYKQDCIQYAKDVVAGKIKAGGNVRECQRFLNDLKRNDIELRSRDPDLVINIIRKIIVHQKGERNFIGGRAGLIPGCLTGNGNQHR